jgi:glycosyltransferase involved in cell wall biosynthesis
MLRSLPHRRGLSRLVYGIETPRVRRYEVEIASRFDEVWVVSPRDRDELVERGAPASIRVIPNGVDPSWIEEAERGGEPRAGAEPRPARILFVGHLAVPHNVDAVRFFAADVMPLIRREKPHAEFIAAGAGAGSELRRLERRGLVTLAGFVPDLRRMLEEASVFVAPLRFAAGVQNKVLEAMAAGRPVVATPEVNAGIGAKPGYEIVLASEPGSFAAETLALMRDPVRSAKLGSAARAFAASRFTWSALRERAEWLAGRRSGGKSP